MKKIVLIVISILCCCNIYSQSELWGITAVGGKYNTGVIFKTDSIGSNQSVQYDFFRYEGVYPYSKLIQASDGKLYGMTYGQSGYTEGCIFQYNPVIDSFIKKYSFGLDGVSPMGYLLEASDGMLYGLTKYGGSSGVGVLFQYNPLTNVYTKKIDFDNTLYGGLPSGSLMQASDGKLYGMATVGGANNNGTIFQYDINTNTCIKKFDFTSSTSGASPTGELIQASNGKLYGMTPAGGLTGWGVLFEYDILLGLYLKKLDFDFATSGGQPKGSLLQASDGKLYGTTYYGGLNSAGVLFQYDPVTSSYIKKMDFSNSAGNGQYPTTGLMEATDGKIYGMTAAGGTLNIGTLFQYDFINNIYTKKLDFNGTNGRDPIGPLMQASNGKLYGMTYKGGIGNGVLFQFDISTSTYSKKFNFGDAPNGSFAASTLIQVSNGLLYGLTNTGGLYNKGVLFQFNPNTNVFIKKHDFDSISGKNPQNVLMQASNGKLYGASKHGGSSNAGVLFEFDPITNNFSKKFDFNGFTDGHSPMGALVEGANGKLYGTTVWGGTGFGSSGNGTIFQYDISTNVFTKYFNFSSESGPTGSLIKTTSGLLYGMTYFGGVNGKGAIFQFDPSSNIYAKKFDFDAIIGAAPRGYLVQAVDGILYGITSLGGTNNLGTIFQYNPLLDVCSKKFDFDNNSGSSYSSLTKSSNGNLYGMTYNGGAINYGSIFEYNLVSGSFNTTYSFNGVNGASPGYAYQTDLTQVFISSGVNMLSEQKSLEEILSINPIPTFGLLTINSNNKMQNVIMTNITGQLMLSESVNEKTHQLQLQNLAEGIYFVKVIYSDGMSVTKKIIVNH